MALIASISAVFAIVAALATVLNARHFRELPSFDSGSGPNGSGPHGALPRLTLVVPARNEQRNVESAVRRMCESNYPDLEVIVVDDRSTDRTGEILDRLAAEYSVLRVVHLDTLPDGWLGKVHALESGWRQATGEVVLFIDGDVQLEPHTLTAAVEVMRADELDHVSMIPAAHSAAAWSQPFLNAIIHALVGAVPGRQVADPESPVGVGSGCFNLARRSALDAIGGFDAIRLEIVDDVALAFRLAKRGFRSRCYSGRGSLHIEWYRDVFDMLRGFEKNAFAGIGFSVPKAVAALLFFAVVWSGWFVAPWLSGSFTVQLCVGSAQLLLGGALMFESRRLGQAAWADLFYPIGGLILPMLLLRSVAKCLVRGGIEWRGTRHSLAELRRARAVDLSELQWIRFGLRSPSADR